MRYQMKNIIYSIIFIFSLLFSFQAGANEKKSWWLLEIKGGKFVPEIDSEFGGNATPFADIYGNDGSIVYKSEINFLLLDFFGSLYAGFETGFYFVSGNSLDEAGEASSDETDLYLLPTALKLVYRFDWLDKKWKIPLVPYGKAGVNYTLWWITQGDGSIATWEPEGGSKASGGTMGYEFTLGVSLILDFFDQKAAHNLEVETGITKTCIFAEYTWSTADNFGSGKTLYLSDQYWMFGMGFSF